MLQAVWKCLQCWW